MRICYIAYSCSPYRGSEDGIGWSLPLEMSKHADVTVITKVEQRPEISRYASEHGLSKNLKVEYCDIPQAYKKFYCGPLQSGRSVRWVRSAAKRAEELHAQKSFDVLHQITPVEFRAIGDYRLNGCRIVVGPVGGAEAAPKNLKKYLRPAAVSELIRDIANAITVRKRSWRQAYRNADVVMFANEETRAYVERCGLDVSRSPVLTELGIDESNVERVQDALDKNGELPLHNPIRLLYMGRFIPRKGIALLLDACRELKNRGVGFELRLCGFGKQEDALKKMVGDYGLSGSVTFFKRVPREGFREQFEWSDVVVMPSVRETTGSVISEAATYLRPVMAFDVFGAKVVLDASSGYLIDASFGAEGMADCIERLQRTGFQSVGGNSLMRLRESLSWSRRIEGRYGKQYEVK